jgi:hypothetical protein
MAEAASPSSHSSFCEEVFSRTARAGTNEVDRTNILASGFTFFPPSPPKLRGLAQLGSRIQLQQRNCSRFARDFLRRSTFSKLAKNWIEK